MNKDQYIEELHNFITDELLPAYIESCVRNNRNPNQSHIIKKLLSIMKTRKPIPAIFKTQIP